MAILGTQLVVLMDELQIGWVYWEDHQQIKNIMGLMAHSFQPPRRSELPDVGNGDGQRQFTIHAPMQRVENGAEYTFTTSSQGGIAEVKKLCEVYGEEMRQHLDQDPVVALDASSYLHSDRSIGRVHTPVLAIVGGVPKGNGNNSGGNAHNQLPPSGTAAKPTKVKSATDEQQF